MTKRPDKVMGTHFFVPAYYMKLLENVRGKHTSPATIATATAFGSKLGKVWSTDVSQSLTRQRIPDHLTTLVSEVRHFFPDSKLTSSQCGTRLNCLNIQFRQRTDYHYFDYSGVMVVSCRAPRIILMNF